MIRPYSHVVVPLGGLVDHALCTLDLAMASVIDVLDLRLLIALGVSMEREELREDIVNAYLVGILQMRPMIIHAS